MSTELPSYGPDAGVARAVRSGRRPSAVWEHFSALRSDRNRVHARCNYCDYCCAGVASRMIQHVATKCPAAPPDVVMALRDDANALKRRKIDSDTVIMKCVARHHLNAAQQSAGLASSSVGLSMPGIWHMPD